MRRGFLCAILVLAAALAARADQASILTREVTHRSKNLLSVVQAIASQTGISPALMHRVAVIGSGTLDILPHNGAVVTLLAICGLTHRDSYFDIVMVGIVSAMLGLIAVILVGTAFGSF